MTALSSYCSQNYLVDIFANFSYHFYKVHFNVHFPLKNFSVIENFSVILKKNFFQLFFIPFRSRCASPGRGFPLFFPDSNTACQSNHRFFLRHSSCAGHGCHSSGIPKPACHRLRQSGFLRSSRSTGSSQTWN